MSDAQSAAWRCTVCGYIHYGPEPPEYCPICGSTRDLFEPYTEATPSQEEAPPAQWRCLNCGYIHSGPNPPAYCPVCGAPEDRFEAYTSEAPGSAQAGGIQEKVVIVGAGIAGISAAEALRNVSSQAEIVVLSKESSLPYYRLNLTRYLAGQVTGAMLDLHPASWYDENRIKLLSGTELRTVDADQKTLALSDGSELGYDKLILTAGSHPFVPPIPGTNRENVTVLRTREHADHILGLCQDAPQCVCIGGGLLGLETAGALAQRGVDVTLLEGHGWLMPRQLNQRAGEMLEAHVTSLGIKIRKQARAQEILGDERVRAIETKDGSLLPADLVVIATGVRSNSYLARMAGLDVNRGVIVDNTLHTSHPDILAAGDVAEHRGVSYGTWAPSQFQGTIAGMNAAGHVARGAAGQGADGRLAEFAGIPRSNILKVLGYDMFSIGQVHPGDASYEVLDGEVEGNYFYFCFRDSFMVSSILLGDTSLSAAVKSIVEKRYDCSACLQQARDVHAILDFAATL